MEDIEYVRSNKGGPKIIHKGYMYTVHKNKKCGGIRWRCAQRSLNCKGSISTNPFGMPFLNMPHNHLPDTYSVAMARSKILCKSGSLNLHSIFDIFLKQPNSDSMPLEQRLKAPLSSASSAVTSEVNEPAVLQSQPLSPTKLKVTRQAAKLPQSSPKPTTPPLDDENMCLKWNSHHSNMQTTFPKLLLKEQYVDATLVAEGQCLKCHRVILSSCSPYFENVLSGISPFQYPILFMKDIPYWIMKAICDFMYAGEVSISKNKLEEILAVAETLKIKGLASNSASEEPEIKSELGSNVKEEKKEELKEVKVRESKEKVKEVKENVKDVRETRRSYQQSPPVEMPVLKSAKLSKSIQQQNVEMPILKSSRFLRNTSKRAEKIERRNEKTERVEKPSKDPPDASGFYDPFDLLEPVYEELTSKSTNAPVKVKETKSVPVKKPLPKKLKKRKVSDDRDESPPPVLSRKGTRSRPNRKIPKFYHTPYDRNTKVLEPIESTPIIREPHTDQADPLMPVEEIKSEPLDVLEDTIEIEDNVMSFSDHELTQEEDMFEDFDTPMVNMNANKMEELKLIDTPGFKKISLLSDPIIMEGPDTVKIVDVADITSPMTTNSILSDDPLNIHQSPTRITITNIQSVLDKDESLSADLGFRISEVMSQVDSKDNNGSPCKDLGFQITSIVSASNEAKNITENEDIQFQILKHNSSGTTIQHDKKDNQVTEISSCYIDSSRDCVEKLKPEDSEIKTAVRLINDKISDHPEDTESKHGKNELKSYSNKEESGLPKLDESSIDQPTRNVTKRGSVECRSGKIVISSSENEWNEYKQVEESMCEKLNILPLECDENDEKCVLPFPQNNILSENVRIENYKTDHHSDNVSTDCREIYNASFDKVAETLNTSNKNNFNQNDNVKIPDLLVDSSSEKPSCYTSQTEIESEDFMQDNIDNLPGFHIAQVVEEQIAMNKENRLTGSLESELSQVPPGEAHGSGSADLRLETSDLETIVNDLTKIVGDARSELEMVNVRNDLTNEIVDSLENLLEK